MLHMVTVRLTPLRVTQLGHAADTNAYLEHEWASLGLDGMEPTQDGGTPTSDTNELVMRVLVSASTRDQGRELARLAVKAALSAARSVKNFGDDDWDPLHIHEAVDPSQVVVDP